MAADRSMYFCPSCRSTFGGTAGVNSYKCSDCGTPLVPMNISEDEWNTKTDAQKQELKEQFKSRVLSDDAFRSAVLNHLSSIGHDLHFIKTVILIWVILTVFAAFIIAVNIL